jgi:hypothetical protein
MQVKRIAPEFATKFNLVQLAPALGVDEVRATPLFQTNLLPDLTQVNFFPPEFAVWFNFVQAAPALGVAAVAGFDNPIKSNDITEREMNLWATLNFMAQP